MDLSTLVIAVVALAALAWLAFLFSSSLGRGARDEVPPNLRPYYTDADLESRRLDRTLATALTVSAFLAISLPLYYLGEADRQASAEEEFHEETVAEGQFIYEQEFECITCHGAQGVGGSAPFVEPRSGISVGWAAPSLNDILYRYDEEEVRFWIVYGRPNTPMPAWGLEGGGPMNEAQVDAVMEYLRSIQIPQRDVLAQVDQRVQAELDRIEQAEGNIEQLIERQQARIDQLQTAEDRLPVAEQLLERLQAAIRQGQGLDSDGDGLPDSAEEEISEVTAGAQEALGLEEFALQLSPTERSSTTNAEGTPVPDPEAAANRLTTLDGEVTTLRITVESLDERLGQAREGLQFLQEAGREQAYAFDYQALADASFDGDVERARRAAGLYNAYCARCHTTGYSAGPAFTREPGSGGMGPALWEGRSLVQFPDVEDHLQFVLDGSENAVGYGVNGVGTGRMPAFGPLLPLEDIQLIVQFERGL